MPIIANGGKYDVSTHVKGKQHKDKTMACASSSSKSIKFVFTPQHSSAVIMQKHCGLHL